MPDVVMRNRIISGKKVQCKQCGTDIELERPISIDLPYCGSCGMSILDAAHNFCGWCGVSLDWDRERKDA